MRLLIFGLVVACGHPLSAAIVLVGNLGESLRATTIVSPDLFAAQSFITDSNSYSLERIDTVLGLAEGDPVVTAELREADPDGALVTAFFLPDLTGSLSVRTLTPVSSVALAPSTVYWLVFTVGGAGSSFGWSYAEGNGKLGPGSFGDYSYFSGGGPWGAAGSDNPYLMRVIADPMVDAPEPSTLLVALAGLGLLATRVRRRSTLL